MLNNIGLPGLLLIAVVVLVLFGRGKVSSLMGEVGKGISSFKKGIKDGSEELERTAAEEKAQIERDAADARARADAALRDVTPADKDKL
ncbi:MAG: twin-arginine translocase TatA/TatE family subunit [Paracoccus sp. (in: a-proteobacteria)]|nr:twin-arginine translocase TatA/TatE family subunit [Paracoccus sp. (in: a-proteobacteria)]MDO5621439.1 twin-arginine translocase TatA/TatE family subunit [Paracoccus sp. (in: a-proteobacteria)]